MPEVTLSFLGTNELLYLDVQFFINSCNSFVIFINYSRINCLQILVVAQLLGQALILNSSMIIDRRIELEDVQEIPYEVTLSAALAPRSSVPSRLTASSRETNN